VKLANGGMIEITCPHGITIKCDTLAVNADSSITLTSPKVTVKSPNFSSGA
jgi:phage gp45-like